MDRNEPENYSLVLQLHFRICLLNLALARYLCHHLSVHNRSPLLLCNEAYVTINALMGNIHSTKLLAVLSGFYPLVVELHNKTPTASIPQRDQLDLCSTTASD